MDPVSIFLLGFVCGLMPFFILVWMMR